MTLEVKIQQYNDLSDDEKACASNNGSGKEYASYLRVEYNGGTIVLENDAMEPEDVRFYRDLSWVQVAILAAYELGKRDAPAKEPQP